MGENLFSHAMSAANFAKSKYEACFNIFQSERKYLISRYEPQIGFFRKKISTFTAK
jgi:hypothetical protein